MQTIFDLHDELNVLRANNDYDSFGVFYQSKSNLTNNHYVIVRSEKELSNLKTLYKDYDFIFTKIGA